MKLSQKISAGLASGALLLASFPATGFAIATSDIDPDYIRSSILRCENLAGRAKDQCYNKHERTRLRLRQSVDTRRQARTLRERRNLTDNTTNRSTVNIRLRGADISNYFDRKNGGRISGTRRSITESFAAARKKCENLKGLEKSSCLRKNVREAQRANY